MVKGIVGILCITALLITALANGIDGALLASGIATILTIATGTTIYKIGKKKGYKEGKEENQQPPAVYEE